MIKNISPYQLGATLYMPVIKDDAFEVATGGKLQNLKSMVLCLEDALLEKDVRKGILRLEELLAEIYEDRLRNPRKDTPLLFVRPRNLHMAHQIAEMPYINVIDGFVAPKVQVGDYAKWVESVRRTDLMLMPTLETADVFDVSAMTALRDEFLLNAPERILALRVGGNDLMSALGLRREGSATLYEGPLFYTISMLMSVMKSKGFDMTSPVFEIIEDQAGLRRELARDVSFGFVGKTVIHPSQIDVVQDAFRVNEIDLQAATKILDVDAPAVFKFGGSMCEPATHRTWAQRILARRDAYGMKNHGCTNVTPIERTVEVAA